MNIPGYRIVRELGSGGMATVYEAVQESLERTVALKVMAPALSADKSFSKRFLREGRTVAHLNHPNIVSIFDIGQADNRHFMAMEYMDGGDLKFRLRGGLPPEQCLSILRQIADALAYAHAEGTVHRDIKPENILFQQKTGRAKLGDFGIARSVGEGTRLTGTGMSVGTPHYMSPEQVKGQGGVDGRSDLYSLGIVFYEMLTGILPYEADNSMAIMMMHVQEPLPELPGKYRRFQHILNRLLAKSPGERYNNARDLVSAIDRLPAGNDAHLPGARSGAAGATQVVARPAMAAKPPSGSNAASTSPAALPVFPDQNAGLNAAKGAMWGVVAVMIAGMIWGSLWLVDQATQPTTTGGNSGAPIVTDEPHRPVNNVGVRAPAQARHDPLRSEVSATGGTVRIMPVPVSASVYLNGEFRGDGVQEIFGRRVGEVLEIIAMAPGYEPAVADIKVPRSGVVEKQLRLSPAARKFPLTVTVDPGDASVKLINVSQDYSPGVLLQPGRYLVGVSRRGYQEMKFWIDVNDRGVEVPVALKRNELKHQPGESFRDCDVCPEMVVLPAGRFQMGSPENEAGRASYESPQHLVSFEWPFAIGKYEVTVLEFTEFVKQTGYFTEAEKDVQINTIGEGDERQFSGRENGCVTPNGEWGFHHGTSWRNPDFSQSPSEPVVCVSRNDALAFIEWLSSRSGQKYRLPTEAEWEYAARGGAVTPYFWGRNANETCNFANGVDKALDTAWGLSPEVSVLACDDGFAATSPVGEFKPNDFGLFDTTGNVEEWTEDCAMMSYEGAPNDGTAWSDSRCSFHSVRGGSWRSLASGLRSANRGVRHRLERDAALGFRVARDL